MGLTTEAIGALKTSADIGAGDHRAGAVGRRSREARGQSRPERRLACRDGAHHHRGPLIGVGDRRYLRARHGRTPRWAQRPTSAASRCRGRRGPGASRMSIRKSPPTRARSRRASKSPIHRDRSSRACRSTRPGRRKQARRRLSFRARRCNKQASGRWCLCLVRTALSMCAKCCLARSVAIASRSRPASRRQIR